LGRARALAYYYESSGPAFEARFSETALPPDQANEVVAWMTWDAHALYLARSAEGPAAPGEHLLVVVMGVARVKAVMVDGSAAPGALLATDGEGGLVPVDADSPVTGAIVGTALESLEAARDGMIWMLVNPR
jgi:hypothetical protein